MGLLIIFSYGLNHSRLLGANSDTLWVAADLFHYEEGHIYYAIDTIHLTQAAKRIERDFLFWFHSLD